MNIRWNKVLVYLDISAPLIVLSIAIGFFLIRKARPGFIDLVLLFFLLLQAGLNSLGNYLQDHLINNHWVYHVNCFLAVSLFTGYFYIVTKAPRQKFFLASGYLFFVLCFLVNLLFIQSYSTFNSYSYALGSFLIVTYTLINFQTILNELSLPNLFSLNLFWINTGLLIYFGSCFFIFVSYHYLSIVSPRYVGILWKTHNVFLAFGCLFFLFAIINSKWIAK